MIFKIKGRSGKTNMCDWDSKRRKPLQPTGPRREIFKIIERTTYSFAYIFFISYLGLNSERTNTKYWPSTPPPLSFCLFLWYIVFRNRIYHIDTCIGGNKHRKLNWLLCILLKLMLPTSKATRGKLTTKNEQHQSPSITTTLPCWRGRNKRNVRDIGGMKSYGREGKPVVNTVV